MSRHLVSFCCNDYRNGAFEGRCWGIHVGDCDVLSLDCRLVYWAPSIQFQERYVKIGRRRFKKSGYQEWVGNWCWNAVWMETRQIVAMLAYLCGQEWFSPDMGCTEAWEAWNGKQFEPAAWEKILLPSESAP